MAEKMLTAQEINELKDLNKSFNSVISSIGETEVKIGLLDKKKVELLKEKEFLLSDYEKLNTKETEITNRLLEKYGEGKIDIESGKIELL